MQPNIFIHPPQSRTRILFCVHRVSIPPPPPSLSDSLLDLTLLNQSPDGLDTFIDRHLGRGLVLLPQLLGFGAPLFNLGVEPLERISHMKVLFQSRGSVRDDVTYDAAICLMEINLEERKLYRQSLIDHSLIASSGS